MFTRFTTATVPVRDREELLRDAVWTSVVKVEIDHQTAPQDLDVSVVVAPFGPVELCSVQATPVHVRRTPKLARLLEEPAVFVGLQVAGSSVVIQHGRSATLRPGEFALYDTATPYTLLNGDGMDQHFFRVPRAALALPDAALASVSATTFGDDHPIAKFAASYLGRLATQTDLQDSTHAEALGAPTIEVLRAAIATRLNDRGLAHPALEATLEARILDHLRRHLADPELSASRVAAALHISVRYLYAVLERSGIVLGDWVRSHRLEGCRRELARPDLRDRTIASIAFRWGFRDAATFSRAFKAEFGMSPREWRRLSGSL
ncbi:helix-turn-helix domain-containing protein [Lysobacter korlensis]|uniref:Helix-turn-helix domain-containing protein n=1 Tax=Lysobacter korlensis TaxID=553636 RepID=A0ABV6RNJ7_9GAMM